MKKIFTLTLVVILGGGLLSSHQLKVRLPKITIINPHQNSTWCTGRTYAITWQVIGPMDKQVNINLSRWPVSKGNIRHIGYHIASGVANDGRFSYRVPGSVKPGKYAVTITTLDGKVSATSSAFAIQTLQITPKPDFNKLIFMEVLKPNTASFWDPGKTYTIKWKTNASGAIKIQLYTYNKKFVRNIVTSPKLPKGPQYSWTIPTDIKVGKYKIRVATTDNKFQGFSQKFSIRTYTTIRKYIVPVQYTVNKRKTTRKNKSTSFCYAALAPYPDPGPGKMRVGHHTVTGDGGYCKTFFRSFAYFDLKPYQGKGLLMKATMVTEKIGGDKFGGAYPNVLDQKWDGGALSLFSVACHRETSTSTGMGEMSYFKFTDSARSWIAYPNQNYGVVFTVFNEGGLQSGWISVRYYKVHLELEILEKE